MSRQPPLDTSDLEPEQEIRTNEPVPAHLRPFLAMIEKVEGPVLPTQLLGRYVHAAMKHATFEQLSDGTWYAEIPKAAGLWADGATMSDAEESLRENLQGWAILKIEDHDRDLPVFDGIDLNVL